MAAGRLTLLFNTVRYLKPRQVFYQVFYRLKRKLSGATPPVVERSTRTLELAPSIPNHTTYLGEHTFAFLNKEKSFETGIDWNYLAFGKLWAYNLNYFDFLNQPNISEQEGTSLIATFCRNHATIREGIEPYPISLRGINWIKFFTRHTISNREFDAVLYSHYRFLSRNIEYHLLGNHLLENGLSLLFAAFYFRDRGFLRKAETIISEELEEQVLKDGAHFELSPMYHCILLNRLLDCLNLVKHNPGPTSGVEELMMRKVSAMLGWLRQVSFKNGDLPLVNDAIAEAAPTTESLLQYAKRLGITPETKPLSDSGYRMIRTPRFELFVDVGNIGPDYIPGHAHADTFNFILHTGKEPIVVDTATSTYEENQRRIEERSTESHNTVTVDNRNQTEVWKSFRVGRRARVTGLRETKDQISATHNGYEFLGYTHRRIWRWNDSQLVISDEISGGSREPNSVARVHFHPEQNVTTEGSHVYAGDIRITCQSRFDIEKYEYAAGYNTTVSGKVLTVYFSRELVIEFSFDQPSDSE